MGLKVLREIKLFPFTILFSVKVQFLFLLNKSLGYGNTNTWE